MAASTLDTTGNRRGLLPKFRGRFCATKILFYSILGVAPGNQGLGETKQNLEIWGSNPGPILADRVLRCLSVFFAVEVCVTIVSYYSCMSLDQNKEKRVAETRKNASIARALNPYFVKLALIYLTRDQ